MNFWTKLTQKRYFRSKKEKKENHHRILHIWISLGSKVQPQQTILIFRNKFAPKKNTSSQKQKKLTSSYEIQISLTTKFQLKLTILIFFLEEICWKNVFPVEIRKSEHHHWILDIRISLGTKFQLKLTIMIFWTKFTRKGYFQLKYKEWTWPLNYPYSN